MEEGKPSKAPGIMGAWAESLEIQREKGQQRAQTMLVRSFADEEIEEPAPAPASVVSEPSPAPKAKADAIQTIDPDKITPWSLADRPEAEFGDITELADSIRRNGQAVAVLVRPGATRGTYELIYGRRRWMACSDLGLPIKAIVRDLDDKEAFKQQMLENGDRQDISTWAKAVSYKRAIEAGVYKNESALASHLGIHRATLSNIMVFNRIPEPVVRAIGSDMKSLGIHSAKALASLTSKEEIEAVITLAPKIAAGKLTNDNIVRSVHAEIEAQPSVVDQNKSRFVTDNSGVKLFSFRVTGRGATEISFTTEAIKRVNQEALIDRLKAIFNDQ